MSTEWHSRRGEYWNGAEYAVDTANPYQAIAVF